MQDRIPNRHEQLVERVRELAVELGAWPPQRRIMRECRVGAPRADAALATLRDEGFDPTPARRLAVVPAAAERGQDDTEEHPADGATRAPGDDAEATTKSAQIDGDSLISGAADTVTPARVQRVPRWPLLIIAAGAFVSIWSGWVGLGKLTGFGPVVLLPGIADGWVINSAITLPLGVEAYAAYAMWAWLSDAPVSARARRFACWSALGALVTLGMAGQEPNKLPPPRTVALHPTITPAASEEPVAPGQDRRAPLSRDRRCSHDRLVLPDRRLPLRHGQVLHPGTAPTIRGHTSRDINGGSLTFTRPAFPWPVTPGWDGGPWAVPRASHPAVTHEVCQGGHEP
jgi:hypothetical protein